MCSFSKVIEFIVCWKIICIIEEKSLPPNMFETTSGNKNKSTPRINTTRLKNELTVYENSIRIESVKNL